MEKNDGEGLLNEPWRVWLINQIGTERGRIGRIADQARVSASSLYKLSKGHTAKPPVDLLMQVARSLDQVEQLTSALAASDGNAPRRPPPSSGSGKLGLAEDAAIFRDELEPWTPKASTNRGRWTVTSRALELAGILPGDIVEFDFAAAPRPGDVVVAQLYRGDNAVTVLRVYRPPALLTATLDDRVDQAPILLDETGSVVNVRGPMVRLLRQPNSTGN